MVPGAPVPRLDLGSRAGMVFERERTMWAIDVGTTNTGVARWTIQATR